MNEEGYRDPTADRAIRSYNRLPHGKKEDLSALCIVARRLGFEVIGVRDKKTGREVILDAERKSEYWKCNRALGNPPDRARREVQDHRTDSHRSRSGIVSIHPRRSYDRLCDISLSSRCEKDAMREEDVL